MSAGGKSSGNINYQEKSTSGEQNGFFSNIEVYQSANFYCDVTIRGSLILTAPLPIISGGTGRSTVGATGQALVSTGSALTYVDVVKSVTLNTSAIPFLFVNSGTSSTITNTGTFTLNALTTGTGDHVVLQTSPILKTNVGLLSSNASTLTLQPSSSTSAYTWIFPSTIGTSGQILVSLGPGNELSWQTPGTFGLGTVTSVSQTVPAFLSVSGSPITTSGTLAITLSGTALPTTSGGTGLTAVGTAGQVLTSNGTTLSWDNTVKSVSQTVPAFLSVSGSPITTSGTLAITLSGTALPTTSGGTGLTTVGTAGQVLTSNGTTLFWDSNVNTDRIIINSTICADVSESQAAPIKGAIYNKGGLYMEKNFYIKGDYLEPFDTGTLNSIKDMNVIKGPVLTSVNPVTYIGASTFTIDGNPTAGTNVTFSGGASITPTNVALLVKGTSYLQGVTTVVGTFTTVGSTSLLGSNTLGTSVTPYVVSQTLLGSVNFGTSLIPYNTSSVSFNRSNITYDKYSTLKIYGTEAAQALYIGQDLSSTNSWLPSIIFQGLSNSEPLLTISVLEGGVAIPSIPRITFGNLVNYSFDIINGTTFYGTRFKERISNQRILDVGVNIRDDFYYEPQVKMTTSSNQTLLMTQTTDSQSIQFKNAGGNNLLNISSISTSDLPSILFADEGNNSMKMAWDSLARRLFWSVSNTSILEMGVTNTDDIPYFKIVGGTCNYSNTTCTWYSDNTNVAQVARITTSEISLTPIGASSSILFQTLGATGSISAICGGTSGSVFIGAAGATGSITISSTGASGTVAINSTGASGAITISSAGGSGAIAMNAIGATGSIVINSSGASGNVLITSAGGSGAILITAVGASGAIAMSAAGASGAITISSAGASGSILITSGGGSGAIALTAVGASGAIAVTAAGASGAITINTAGAAGTILVTSAGLGSGAIALTAVGTSGAIGITAAGASGAIAITAAGAAGNCIITALGASGFVAITAAGASGYVALTAAGATGNITITAAGASGKIFMTSVGVSGGIIITSGGGDGALILSAIGVGGIIQVTAGAADGKINLTTGGARSMINLTAVGAESAINLFATAAVSSINIIGTGASSTVRVGSNLGGDVVVYTQAGNTQIISNTGALQFAAYAGGANFGWNDANRLGRFYVTTSNGFTGFQTGDILFETQTVEGYTGPGNFLVDTTQAYTGNITIRSKGNLLLQSQDNIILDSLNGCTSIGPFFTRGRVYPLPSSNIMLTRQSMQTIIYTGTTSSGFTQITFLPITDDFIDGSTFTFYNQSILPVTIKTISGSIVTVIYPNSVVSVLLANYSTSYWIPTLISGTGTGTVTSVEVTVPPFMTVTGSPITSSGNFKN